MKHFFARIGRFFWSRGFLKVVLWTTTIIVLFYAEEDWRGAHAWSATKAKWEARGETFDYAKFTPPPVPDAQNLGALPLFHVVEKTYLNGAVPTHDLDAANLQAALRPRDWGDADLPVVNGWIWEESPDIDKIQANVADHYAKVFKKLPAVDPRAQFEELFPFLPSLRAAAAERPFCRFAYDDTQALPASRGLQLVTGQIRLSRILVIDGLLALHQKQSDVALADFATILKLKAGIDRDPSLVAGLVGLGMVAIGNEVIWDGLARHAWNDAQLAEIQRQQQQLDFLAVYRFDMSAEGAVTAGNLDYFRNVRPSDLNIALGMELQQPQPIPLTSWQALLTDSYALTDRYFRFYYEAWPRGWFDLNKAKAVDFILSARDEVDDRARRADLEVGRDVEARQQKLRDSTWGLAPWNVVAVDMVAMLEKTSLKFCVGQVRADQTRIACALERYWLVHHAYPATLDELVPNQIAALPHDVMDGQPYRYRVRADGTYLLYSVGWNQRDDGGTVVLGPADPGLSRPKQINYEQGDWVWPTPKISPTR